MFLLRHGQSYFNLHFDRTGVDPGIEDPELAPLGVQQAAAAAKQLARAELTRIIISPFTRALQTAEPVVATHRAAVEIMHEARERRAFACDVGSSPAALAAKFPQHRFEHLPERWWSERMETDAQTVARANGFRRLVAARADSATTLLVSHWAFILALTGTSLENGELLEYDASGSPPTRVPWDD